MIQGTGPSAGESLDRGSALHDLFRQGNAPFKTQNIALNSFITPNVGEIDTGVDYDAMKEKAIDNLADIVRKHVDIDFIVRCMEQ